MTGLDLTEMESYLASYRENNPLTESEVKTRDFYSALFAEHLSDSADISRCDNVETDSSGEDEPQQAEVTVKGSDRQDQLVECFVAACEKNAFDDCVQVSEETCACAVMSSKAIGNLLRWVDAASRGGDPAVVADVILAGVLAGNCDTARTLLMEDTWVQTTVAGLVEDKLATSALVVTCLQLIMSFDGGTKADGCQAAKYVCQLLSPLDQESPGYTKCLEVLLPLRPLDEFSIEVVDAVFLGLDGAIDAPRPQLLVQLGQVLRLTSLSNNDTLSKGTRYGKFLINTLKKLPRQVPRECLEAVSQAVHSTKSFLKKPAEAELRKLSPLP